MSRQRIHFLVEGNAEQNLVERILAPHLALLGLDCFAQRFRTRRDLRRGQVFKGGGTNYAKPRKDLERMIAQWRNHSDVWLTTSFDLYEIPSDFPGYAAAMTDTICLN